MKLKGKQIRIYREEKGLTQKELAQKTNLNTRTIQRLENVDAKPRTYTMKSIAKVLEISLDDIQTNDATKNVWNKLIDIMGLIISNIVIVSVYGYLIMDSEANFNSYIGSLLLSLTLPFVVYSFTKKLTKGERLLKFGFGLWLYVVLLVILHNSLIIISKGLVYPVVIFSVLLYLIPKIRS